MSRTQATAEPSLFDPAIVKPALLESVRKLSPRLVAKNPVMFVVEVGSALTTLIWLRDLVAAPADAQPAAFTFFVSVWLWFTVLFANFAEAVAEGRGKAQAANLRRMRQDSVARRLARASTAIAGDGSAAAFSAGAAEEKISASSLRKGDVVVVEAGELIPGDGEIIVGIASVDESAITGESAPVIREAGGDRSAVTGGTRVLSDRIVVRITADPGESFLDRMIALVEGAARQKTPNEIALHILLVGLTIVFLLACVTLVPMALYSGIGLSATVVVALLVCLIPTTIGGLLSAIGIAGMDRLLKKNVLAMSGRAVEAAGDVDTLLLDKTGTITLGNRMATELIPMPGVRAEDLADASQLASLADETPEGRSIVVLVKEAFQLRGREIQDLGATFVPFSAHTRMSGCDLDGPPHPEGRRGRDRQARPVARRQRSPGAREDQRRDRRQRRDAARRDRRRARARRDPLEGRRQRRHPRALRSFPRHGDPHRDDHRRQSAHRGRDRPRGGSGRLPRRGHARGQARPHPGRAGKGKARRDDRRRHERCPGARPGDVGVAMNTGNAGRPRKPATWSTSTRTRPSCSRWSRSGSSSS
jgi:K+-transporting ATPase B subunit